MSSSWQVHTAALTHDGAIYSWGRNENWQLGYEVTGLLNAGQSLDEAEHALAVLLPGPGQREREGEAPSPPRSMRCTTRLAPWLPPPKGRSHFFGWG